MDFIYNIAGLILKIDGPAADLGYIEGFDLFKIPNEQTITPDITISTGIKIPDWRFSNAARLLHTQEFEGIECTLWRGPETYFFRMSSPEYGTACFIYNAKSCTVTCDAGAEISSGGGKGVPPPIIMRFLIWTAFNMASINTKSVAIHSSVIMYRQRAVMFLGESGTGKSTHTALWRKTIPQSMLLNDDSPILRIMEGRPVVFGSPWSGKLPCYKNISVPVAAIVRLSQAPYNKIRRLQKIEAFGAIFPSSPPSFATDETLTDMVCAILSDVIATVPVYHLECLPDSQAALLSMKTIFG